MISLKALSDQALIIYHCLSFRKLIIFNYGFTTKVNCAFRLKETILEILDFKITKTVPLRLKQIDD